MQIQILTPTCDQLSAFRPAEKCRKGPKRQQVFCRFADETELHDLPTELLLRILEDLSDSDLYSISFHSPRLHPLAISMYLSHHEIFDDGFAAISEESGLQLTNSLQVAALPCIILLAFSDSIFKAGLGIRERDKGVHKPEVLINRMSRVRHITLDSDDIDV
jgi:hypothetical protein